MSDSLQPHELQHARPPCPSATPGVHSNSHPSSPWCHPAISAEAKNWDGFQHQKHFQVGLKRIKIGQNEGKLLDFWDSIQFSSVIQSCPTLCDPMGWSTPGLPVHLQFPEFTQTHVHWVSEAIQLSHPLSSPSPPAFNLSQHQGLFKWASSLHRSFSFSISPSNEYSGLISFRMDWLDLLAVQGALKSLLQHHSSTASILQCSAVFIVQLSHPKHPHDYWEKHSFDYMDICQQSHVSAF